MQGALCTQPSVQGDRICAGGCTDEPVRSALCFADLHRGRHPVPDLVQNETFRAGKSDAQRIVRLLVTVNNPPAQRLYDAAGGLQGERSFAKFAAFEAGRCSGPAPWDCNFDGVGVRPMEAEMRSAGSWRLGVAHGYVGPDLPPPVYYSLPGPCPSHRYGEKTAGCIALEPGGECPKPSGAKDCTWSAEYAGEVTLDALEGISSFEEFHLSGGREYQKSTDRGVKMTFWDGVRDVAKCVERVRRAEALFAAL